MPKLCIERCYYRSGQIHTEAGALDGKFHGLLRSWHRNGRLASREPYRYGLLHGVCRQWNEEGKLLGSYQMKNGTGIQRACYENGRLQMEFSTVNGRRTGRRRFWLRDGTLASEAWLIEDQNVSRMEYQKTATEHLDWPHYPNERSRPRTLSRKQFEIRVFELHCEWLVSRPNKHGASEWLAQGNAASRSMGQLGFQKAKSLVAAVACHKADQVLAVDIYRSKQGKEFCDNLLIRLPKSKRQRLAIRRLFKCLPSRARCAVQPDKDDAREWLFVYFG
jgi:hypothetical protein